MAKRPILFSGAMTRAILAGTKSQTRRIIKVQPDQWTTPDGPGMSAIWPAVNRHGKCEAMRCPYGLPGDMLWVRENGWERPERTPKMMREGADTWAPYYFDADYEFSATRDNEFAEFKEWGFKRRPSIHMPRWASRILLEITAVRVERLNDISPEDAIAEGIESWSPKARKAPIGTYRELWEKINGPESWSANPFVWVVEFRRVTP